MARSNGFCARSVITIDTGMSYATNPNNLRLEIADLIEDSDRPNGRPPEGRHIA